MRSAPPPIVSPGPASPIRRSTRSCSPRSCSAVDALRSAASASPIAVDLGTGSGAIALAMATEVPHARVFAAENSVDAYVWTKENFERVGAANAQLAFIDLEHAFP